VRPSRPPVH